MIKINEKLIPYKSNITLFQLKEKYKPNADVLIYNGYPITEDQTIKDQDEIVLIKRGEIPSQDELESLMVARHTPKIHNKLKQSVIGIAGAGGLGSPIAIALARVGLGKLIIADYDIVEPSNLNRQQYFVHQIGLSKVMALKDNLAQINPYVEVEAHQVELTENNISIIFETCSILVEAFDRSEMKSMLVNSFLEKYPDRFVISASGTAGFDSNNLIKTKQFGNNLFVVGDDFNEAKIGNGLMAPRVGITAHHQANQVIRILLGESL